MFQYSQAQLLEMTIDQLRPVVRDLYLYPDGVTARESVNPTGVDLHVGQIIAAAMDNPGTPTEVAHSYAVIWPWPGRPRHRRLSRGASSSMYRFQITVAGGDIERAMYAMEQVSGRLDAARLGGMATGSLKQVLEAGPLRPDKSVSPPRWFSPLEYWATLH